MPRNRKNLPNRDDQDIPTPPKGKGNTNPAPPKTYLTLDQLRTLFQQSVLPTEPPPDPNQPMLHDAHIKKFRINFIVAVMEMMEEVDNTGFEGSSGAPMSCSHYPRPPPAISVLRKRAVGTSQSANAPAWSIGTVFGVFIDNINQSSTPLSPDISVYEPSATAGEAMDAVYRWVHHHVTRNTGRDLKKAGGCWPAEALREWRYRRGPADNQHPICDMDAAVWESGCDGCHWKGFPEESESRCATAQDSDPEEYEWGGHLRDGY